MVKEKEGFNLDKRFVYGLVIVAVIVAVYFLAFDTTTSNINMNEDFNGEIDVIRARVNGMAVYDSDVERAQTVYKTQTGEDLGEGAALEHAITELLMAEEADKRGVTISKEEAERQIFLIAQRQGLTLNQVREGYESQGRDYDESLEKYINQIKAERLTKEILGGVPEVTDAEASVYYEENKQELFANSEVVMTYSKISAQLKQALSQEKKKEVFNEFVEELKAEADIEYVSE